MINPATNTPMASNYLKRTTHVYLMSSAALQGLDANVTFMDLNGECIVHYDSVYEWCVPTLLESGVHRALWGMEAHVRYRTHMSGCWVVKSLKLVGILTKGLDQLTAMEVEDSDDRDPVVEVKRFCSAVLNDILDHPDWYVLIKVIYYP